MRPIPACSRLSQSEAETQHESLYPARVQLLRRARIAEAHHVLELGTGWGFAAEELRRRCGGEVVALDATRHAWPSPAAGLTFVQADIHQLPFPQESFDLVFAQFTLLWAEDWPRVLEEIHRVLTPEGRVALIEPDFGGLIEEPAETEVRAVWLDALSAAGACPQVGRKLAYQLSRTPWTAQTTIFSQANLTSTDRLRYLAELPLTSSQLDTLRRAETAIRELGHTLAYLPCFCILARKADPNPRRGLADPVVA